MTKMFIGLGCAALLAGLTGCSQERENSTVMPPPQPNVTTSVAAPMAPATNTATLASQSNNAVYPAVPAATATAPAVAVPVNRAPASGATPDTIQKAPALQGSEPGKGPI